MRKTIRHVAVLAAAVAMLTAIAVPAQGAMAPPVDSFEVTCGPNHYVTVEAADESRNERERYLTLWLWIPSPDPPAGCSSTATGSGAPASSSSRSPEMWEPASTPPRCG